MAVITGLASELGTPVPITDLGDTDVSSESVAQLHTRGQRLCPVFDDELPPMKASVRRTLRSGGCATANVDRVIVASESILISASKREHETRRARLYQAFVELGLGHAPVLLMTFAGCGSAIAALEYASLLVDTGASRQVLVVAVDRVLDRAGRVLPAYVSIIGDGVASCVVGPAGANPGWLLHGIRRRAYLRTVRSDGDLGSVLVPLARALGSIAADVRAETSALDDAPVLFNNYGLPTLRMYARALEIDPAQVFTDNVARTGHVGSVDPLINLESMAERDRTVAILATGPGDCVFAFLTPYHPPDPDQPDAGAHAHTHADAGQGRSAARRRPPR